MSEACGYCLSIKSRVEAGDCPAGNWWWECRFCKKRWIRANAPTGSLAVVDTQEIKK
jgi:hypothetical protein